MKVLTIRWEHCADCWFVRYDDDNRAYCSKSEFIEIDDPFGDIPLGCPIESEE